MKLKKTYEAGTWQGFNMGLNLRGKPINIEFDPGTAQPVRVNNKFTTDDEELQKVIEATRHVRIGKVYIISTEKEVLSEGIFDTSGEKPLPMDPASGEVIVKDEPVLEVKTCTEYEAKTLKYKTWQQVGDYLVIHRKVDPSLVSNPGDISKVAKEQNISLPHLE